MVNLGYSMRRHVRPAISQNTLCSDDKFQKLLGFISMISVYLLFKFHKVFKESVRMRI